jgi:hypothetical protein
MKRFLISTILLTLAATSCAGIPLPFTDARLANWPIESKRVQVNSTCIEIIQLTIIADAWEAKHLHYIQTRDDSEAIHVEELISSLGKACKAKIDRLNVSEVKQELFGDIQTISDSSKLRELGGIAFRYSNVSTKSGIEPSLHLRGQSQGPNRRLVAVFKLADGRVLHYNYSGSDNVDQKTRRWPVQEFFGLVAGAGMRMIP